MYSMTLLEMGRHTCAPTTASLLSEAEMHLRTGADPTPALDAIFGRAQSERVAFPAEWSTLSRDYISHPIHTLLCEDPMTGRAFTRPRGYAGDAVMMDYLYQLGDTAGALARTTPLGREIYQFVATRPAASGVRWRREHIAGIVDTIAGPRPARVLAIACGHLREAAICEALQNGNVQEFLALDGDAESVCEVLTSYAHLGVTARQATVREILTGKAAVAGQYDFVYAAGLYDYLTLPVARALTARMLKACAAGGSVLVPNFLPEVADRGYMESVMDWQLIYRAEKDMHAIVAGLPEAAGCTVDCYDDPYGAVTYLRITKPE
jgi:hypothetical protein